MKRAIALLQSEVVALERQRDAAQNRSDLLAAEALRFQGEINGVREAIAELQALKNKEFPNAE